MVFFQEIESKYPEEFNILIKEIFYGKGNLKRGNGIQELTHKKISSIQHIFDGIYRYIKETN